MPFCDYVVLSPSSLTNVGYMLVTVSDTGTRSPGMYYPTYVLVPGYGMLCLDRIRKVLSNSLYQQVLTLLGRVLCCDGTVPVPVLVPEGTYQVAVKAPTVSI
jgi:hypothetical protein